MRAGPPDEVKAAPRDKLERPRRIWRNGPRGLAVTTPPNALETIGSMDDAALEAVRIDKWLWAARFFKTRSLAAQAVSGGLVRIAEQRVKASRRLRRGEVVHVRRGAQAWDVVVMGLCEQRRPAPEAQTLYEETPESVEKRTSEEARREQARMRRARGPGRPTKRERRALERWRDSRSGDAAEGPGDEDVSLHR